MQRKCQSISFFLCAFLLIGFAVNAQVVYVDQTNTSGTEDGLSWATAYTAIQDGIDAAGAGGEVWVAAGTYNEMRGGVSHNAGALHLPENLSLYGGFMGNEADRNQRDWETHPTIIDGSTANDGKPANHVVTGANGTILDGFTVTGGGDPEGDPRDYSPNLGAGLRGFIDGKIANCIVTGNDGFASGGGLYTMGSSPLENTIELSNVQFINNSCVHHGAGAYFARIDVTITDCSFQNNSNVHGKGGGLNVSNGALTLLNSVFENNYSENGSGGATYLEQLSALHNNEVSDCTFINNKAQHSGGALHTSSCGNLTITDTTFKENETFNSHSSSGGGALFAHNVNDLVLSGCDLHENKAAAGGALYLYEGVDFIIIDCLIQKNFAYSEGGAIKIINGALDIEINNELYTDASNVFENCIISDNVTHEGAGLVVEGISNVIAGNCTLTANYSTAGAAIQNYNSAVTLYNSILWGNHPNAYENYEDPFNNSSYIGTIAFSSIVDQNIQGEDNISSNPHLVHSPSSIWTPLPDSPAIDAGDSLYATTADYFGTLRPQGAGVDIGAYEQPQSWSDTDNDGIPDYIEGNADLDEDNIPNYLDPDSDGDGLLDSEESGSDLDMDGSSSIYDADSDNNGVNDGSEGTLDQDNDGIPDYADLDNDDDGLLDTYELANGLDYNVVDTQLDLDEDGVSNELEFMLGTSPQDPNEPPADVYVAMNGSDISGEGTETNPWLTLNAALYRVAKQFYSASQIYVSTATQGHPVTIHADAGVYEEQVVLEENVFIQGAGMSETKIQYYDELDTTHNIVIAAENSRLRNLAVTLPSLITNTVTLVRAENVSVELDHVLLDGRLSRYTTGIVVNGVDSSNTTIHDSVFQRLNDGVYAIDTAATISNNTFQDILGYAVFIAPPDEKQAIPATPLLGLSNTIEQVGLNRFRNVAGYFVQNFTQAEVSAQLNDWGTDDPDEIARKLSSNVQFEPYISSNLEASSIVVQLLNASTGEPLSLGISANVSTANKEAGAYRDTASGLFILPNIGEGTWNLVATARGYEDGTAEISLTGLDIEAIEIELTPKQDGDVVVGCAAGTSAATGSKLGDIFIITFCLVILFSRKIWAKFPYMGI